MVTADKSILSAVTDKKYRVTANKSILSAVTDKNIELPLIKIYYQR
jgi:hypothetical protein